jgi:AraC-like DNA-binding protein
MTRGLCRALAPSAADKEALAQRIGVDELPDGRIRDDIAHALWQVADAAAGDDDFGLHFAERATLEDLGIVAYIGRASPTFGEACARVVRHLRLLKDATEVQLTRDGDLWTLVDGPAANEPPWSRQLAEAVLALWWLWPQRLARAASPPRYVGFAHRRPASTREHERLFGCAVAFEQPRNQLVFGPELWTLPFASADPLLADYLEAAARWESSQLRAGDAFVEQLERAIADLMPSGQIGARRVARSVAVSERTLHRQLSRRGLTYQRIVDGVRRRAAIALLERTEHSVNEVAFLVGFSDASGLRRAYHRWTGRAPRR